MCKFIIYHLSLLKNIFCSNEWQNVVQISFTVTFKYLASISIAIDLTLDTSIDPACFTIVAKPECMCILIFKFLFFKILCLWLWGHCMSVHNWQLLYLVCVVGSEVLRIMAIICLVPLSQVKVSLWPWRRKQQVLTSDKSTLTTQWQTFMYFYLLWSPTYKILDLQNCH